MLDLLMFTALKAQEEEIDFDMQCEYILILGAVLLLLYILFLIYQHYIGRWTPREHYCKYCGRRVIATSDCCHSYVDDSSIPNICKACGQPCRSVCNLCKRQF